MSGSTIALLILFLLTLGFSGILLYLAKTRIAKGQGKLSELESDLRVAKKELDSANQSLEEALRKQKEEEPQISGAVSKDVILKKALKRAEETNFLKNAFLSNISHEIRTPLNNIIGFASLLEAEISLLENKELFDYAHAISDSGDRLLHLLNNIIDISRIESNDMLMSLKPCNVNSIIGSVSQLFLFKANEQKLKLNFIAGEIPEGLADETGLTKVLTAIIENAISYTEHGFVNISSEYNSDAREISIRIKDSGVGIDPAYLSEIFDAFRNESAGYSKEAQGAGLGLPLAKSLIELMGGKIEITSEKGKGTVVTLFLRTPEERPSPAAQKEISKKVKFKTLQNLEIFIVEDDLMNKIVLYEMTKSLGNVESAVNGDETLKIMERTYLEGKLFDIMLFDINLPPPWDGIKLMLEIRKKYPEYKSIPFIAQTAYAMAGDREKLLEAGFDDYISKPINQQALYSIMKNQLNKL
jgi:signal transduction histidine kinase/CheY-like chemotaxis protein